MRWPALIAGHERALGGKTSARLAQELADDLVRAVVAPLAAVGVQDVPGPRSDSECQSQTVRIQHKIADADGDEHDAGQQIHRPVVARDEADD